MHQAFRSLLGTLLFAAVFAMLPHKCVAADSKLSLTIYLTDGSSVVGTPSISELRVKSDVMTAGIPLKRIDHIVFDADSEAGTVHLRNGDKISGVLELKEITITGALGKIAVPKTTMKRIVVREFGDGAVPLNFKLEAIKGSCSVKGPAAAAFEITNTPATCDLGTAVKTGKGSVSLRLGGNTCKLGPNTEVSINKPKKVGDMPWIDLKSGEISVKSDRFYAVTVKSGDSAYSGKGSAFSLRQERDRDMSVDTISCSAGPVTLRQPNFEVTTGDGASTFSLAFSKDGEFCRLKSLIGRMSATVPEGNGGQQTLDIEPKGIMKVWTRRNGAMVAITCIVTTPEGRVDKAVTATR